MEWIFGGDEVGSNLAPHQILFRAFAIYCVGVALVRVGKSRLVGRVSALDILVGFILGSLLGRGITGSASLSETAIASTALVASHWLFTRLSYHSRLFGAITKGCSVPLIERGELLVDNMRRSHISQNDLLEVARLRGLAGLGAVETAYEERNGDISVIAKRSAAS